MYDDLINNVSYKIVADFLCINNTFMELCASFSLSFGAIIGVAVGCKILRDIFNSI